MLSITDATSFQTFMTLFAEHKRRYFEKCLFSIKKSKGFHFVFTPLAIIIWTQMLNILHISTSMFHRKKPYRKEIRPSK